MAKPQRKYDLVDEHTQEGKEVAELLAKIRAIPQHNELRDAQIAVAWMIGKQPDVDGRIVLGQMKKASELERQLHGFDAIVIINREHWQIFNEEQRTALLDHELCHLAPALDADFEQKLDGHGRDQWRIRKHDVEEFRGVIQRHGCYKDDLESFVEAANQAQGRLFGKKKSPRKTPIPKANGAEAPATS
jgi:hypothetical protein